MDITQIITTLTTIIGGSTLVFQGLYQIAKLTKSERDDNFFKKILNALTTLTGVIALDNKVLVKETKLEIKIKQT